MQISNIKLCFTSTDKDFLAKTLFELSQLPECQFVKLSASPRDDMYLGRCFFTSDEVAGKYWAIYKPNKKLMCNIQDDDFAKRFRPSDQSNLSKPEQDKVNEKEQNSLVEIVYPSENYFESFHRTLDQVAREQVYIEMIEAKPYEEVASFQRKLVTNN